MFHLHIHRSFAMIVGQLQDACASCAECCVQDIIKWNNTLIRFTVDTNNGFNTTNTVLSIYLVFLSESVNLEAFSV